MSDDSLRFKKIVAPASWIVEDRLTIMLIDSYNVDDVYNLALKNQARLSKFHHWATLIALPKENVEKYDRDLEDGTAAHYVIYDSTFVAGKISANSINNTNETIEIGYWIGEEFEGKGIMYMAARSFIEQFYKRGFRRFVIKCSVHNERSNRLAQRLGAKLEGVAVRAERIGNKFYDWNMYALVLNDK